MMKLKSVTMPKATFESNSCSTTLNLSYFSELVVKKFILFSLDHFLTPVSFSSCFRPSFTSLFVIAKTKFKSGSFFMASSTGIERSDVPKKATFIEEFLFMLQPQDNGQNPFRLIFRQRFLK